MNKFAFIAVLLFPLWSIAQTPENCGVGLQAGQLIKDRMLRQRANMPAKQLQKAWESRVVTYIPVTFHMVGTSGGENYPSVQGVLQNLCRLNDDFADQDIQFYIADQLNYLPNSTIFNDAWGNGAGNQMSGNKIAGTLNYYVGANVSESVAGFYSPWGDYVWVKRGYVNGTSTTATHELGHFFTLPHTFYGWEGVDYPDEYGWSPAPTSVNGDAVEYVARTGGNKNCHFAADGFCDTNADYLSSRTSCAGSLLAFDPDSVRLDFDTHLYMSYFNDACVDSFSIEQKDAILTDITNRGWYGGQLPAGISAIPDTMITNVSPLPNAEIDLDFNLRLSWEAIPGAAKYYVELHRTFFGSDFEEVTNLILSDTTTTVSAAALMEGWTYRWKVTPYNNYYSCAPQAQFLFTVGEITGLEAVEATSFNFEIFPNPSPQNTNASLAVTCQKDLLASIKLYSIDGRLLTLWENQLLNRGKNSFGLQTATLEPGIYLVLLSTEEGSQSRKIIIR